MRVRPHHALFLWPGAVLLAAQCALAASAPWAPYAAWKVRRTVGIPPAGKKEPQLPGSDCCYVAFPTASFLQPDGRDLRVAIGGKPAQFKIIDIAYGGFVRLLAAVPKQAQQMHVYYGNPTASKVPDNWTPRRGLWIETRRYLGGECRTLSGIRQAWAKAAGQRDGAGPAGNVYHGHNPFGPSDNYLTRYTGYFHLPKTATVNFSVGADEIGYIVVEGREVAAKKNWGPMNRRRRYAGEAIRLDAGLHPIQVYHVERAGPQNIAAAWWMQGMKRGQKYKHYQIIPAKAFAPLRHGRLLSYEVQGQALGADFSHSNDGDVPLDVPGLGRRVLTRYVFRDLSRPATRALQCSPLWDFGDGTTSTARDPSHVYLKPGEYTVTLTLRRGQRSWQVAQKIKVGPGYHRAARRQWDRLRNYYPIVKDYQFDKMATAEIITAARIFEELEKPEEIIAACRVLYERRKDLDGAALVRHCLLLGRHLREDEGEDGDEGEANARKAVEIFTYAERHTDDIKAKARLANEKGDVYYYFLNDLAAAQKEYTKTLTTYAKATDNQVRLAQIRLGDVYRTKGDAAAARRAYERATGLPTGNISEAVSAARRGSFPRTVEDYLRRKLLKEALKELGHWEWEFPLARLDGYSSLLRAKVALAQDNRKEAIKQSEELLRVNKDSEYADDILLFLTALHQRAGQLDKALAAASRLLDEHPASELQELAHLKRVVIHLARAKYAEAAAEALALADANEDSENAPKALLLAATAQLRNKKRDAAVQTLERLSQKYATSAEATQAIKMLKELRRR